MIWPKSVKFPAPIPSTNVTLLTVFFALHRERCVGLLSVCISSIEEKVNVKKRNFNCVMSNLGIVAYSQKVF